jgi:hypothetical protein
MADPPSGGHYNKRAIVHTCDRGPAENTEWIAGHGANDSVFGSQPFRTNTGAEQQTLGAWPEEIQISPQNHGEIWNRRSQRAREESCIERYDLVCSL